MGLHAIHWVVYAALTVVFSTAAGAIDLPDRQNAVTDTAQMFSAEARTKLTSAADVLRSTHRVDVAIVTVRHVNGQSVEQAAQRLWDQWGMGQPRKAVLILVVREDRRVRIQVGKGLRAALTDKECDSILRKTMLPAFKAGRYAEGLVAGLERMDQAIRQTESQADPSIGMAWVGGGIALLMILGGAHMVGCGLAARTWIILGTGVLLSGLPLFVVIFSLYKEGMNAMWYAIATVFPTGVALWAYRWVRRTPARLAAFRGVNHANSSDWIPTAEGPSDPTSSDSSSSSGGASGSW